MSERGNKGGNGITFCPRCLEWRTGEDGHRLCYVCEGRACPECRQRWTAPAAHSCRSWKPETHTTYAGPDQQRPDLNTGVRTPQGDKEEANA